MSRLRRSVPLALYFFLFLAPLLQLGLAQSSTTPTGPNGASRVQIAASEAKIVLTITLAQKSESATPARISASLVSPDDVVRAASNDEVVLRPGQNKVAVTIMRPFHGIPVAEINDLHWLRVKYEVKANSGEILASGIEALRTPETDPFVLTAAAGRIVSQGRAYEARAHVQTSRGTSFRGVPIHAELTWEGMRDTEKIKASSRSDAAGNATLKFTLPDRLPAQTGELSVSARRGLVGRVVEHDVFFHALRYLLLDSDKNIYQPGQTLHARVLYFDPKRKAVANEVLDVRISDEENTLVSRQSITTSAFGVASFDWAIPMNARQGNYMLQIKPASSDEDNERGTEISKSIRVYRFDLPNFRVTAKADRVYYLPSQNAQVIVTAEYLFGKPVTRGKVRIVQEEERNWNYRKQQWESEESQVQAGELNRDGSFTARFDLSEKHEDIADDNYREYRDVNVAAYVTDLTTGRTEQRRLALRVTREPIHVYMVQAQSYSEKLPPSYYISTFYADGAPARCKVKLSLVNEDDHSKVKQQVGTVETNKYGLVKAKNLKFDLDDTHDTLLAEALDAKGLKGHGRERLYDNEEDVIQVTGSRSILKPGDPIEVVLRSTKPARVVVQAVREGAVLGSQRLSLGRGAALVTFPYESRFKDEVTIVAYSLEEPVDSYRYLWGSRTVLYPKNRNLEVDLKLDKDEHRPGDAAVARIAVRLPDKSATESALGVKVVDHAVAERARTDAEFGNDRSYYWRWSLWSSGYGEFSGITREDLDRIDLSEPVPEDLDLVAEYLLRDSRSDLPELMSDKSESKPENVFSKYFRGQMAPVVSALTAWNEKGKLPRNVDEVRVAAREKDTDLNALRDPWGTPYKYQVHFSRSDFIFSFLSAGPDKQFDTKDDVEARQTRERYFRYYGDAMTRASEQLAKNESRFIRDRETLDSELRKQGIEFEALRDPWGKPYETHFEIVGSNFVTRVSSVGEVGTDGKTIETMVWVAQVDYFTQARVQIDRALTEVASFAGSGEDFLRCVAAGRAIESGGSGRELSPGDRSGAEAARPRRARTQVASGVVQNIFLTVRNP